MSLEDAILKHAEALHALAQALNHATQPGAKPILQGTPAEQMPTSAPPVSAAPPKEKTVRTVEEKTVRTVEDKAVATTDATGAPTTPETIQAYFDALKKSFLAACEIDDSEALTLFTAFNDVKGKTVTRLSAVQPADYPAFKLAIEQSFPTIKVEV